MASLYQQLTSRFSGLSRAQKIWTSVGIGVATIVFATAARVLAYRVSEKRSPFNSYSTSEEAINGVDLAGKVAIVTGANTGIGKQTAKMLYKQGCRVVMACRTPSKGEAAKQEILDTVGSSKGSLSVMQLDLNSLQSVRDFATAFASQFDALNYLINNAGIMMLPNFTTTADGYEAQFAVNHLAHFYLTTLLLPTVIKSKGRVVNLSSSAHRRCAFGAFDSFLSKTSANQDGPAREDYSGAANYGLAKTANILFGRELHRRYSKQGMTACSVHPGWVDTELTRHIKIDFAAICLLVYLLLFVYLDDHKTISQGAASTLRCVSLSDEELKGGHYYHNCRSYEGRTVLTGAAQESLKRQYDDFEKESIEGRLWTLSEQLITKKGFKLTL